MRYAFWFFLHNVIAHPLLIFSNRKSSIPGRFHDYTAGKMEQIEAAEKEIKRLAWEEKKKQPKQAWELTPLEREYRIPCCRDGSDCNEYWDRTCEKATQSVAHLSAHERAGIIAPPPPPIAPNIEFKFTLDAKQLKRKLDEMDAADRRT